MENTGTFGLEIYASNKHFYSGRGRYLVIPSSDGQQAIMAHHEDMFIAIVPGILRYEKPDGTSEDVVISNGLVEIVNNRVKVFVHTAERPEDIDQLRAREAKERAQEQLRQKQSIQEYHLNQLALTRAMSRLSITGKHDLR